VLENFLHDAAGIPADWNSGNVIAEQVAKIRAQVGTGKVICGLSGGVDSAVAAALVHKAVGDQLVCVFVDHGLLAPTSGCRSSATTWPPPESGWSRSTPPSSS